MLATKLSRAHQQDNYTFQLKRKYLARKDTAQDLHRNNVLENQHFSPASKIKKLAQKACNNQKVCIRVLTLSNLGIPQCCKAKLMTFLQLGHQQGIPSISEIKKKLF
jgi:hypothetical protein